MSLNNKGNKGNNDMAYNYIPSLSTCNGLQITYFKNQHLSVALIIKFVETINREVNEYTSFRRNAPRLGILLSINFLLALLKEET